MARTVGLMSGGARALILLIAVALSIPAIAMLWTDDAERSRWENRELVAFPRLLDASPEQPGFFVGLEDWLDDHFGFALVLNRIYRKLVFYVFADPPSPRVSLGRDGFVFLNSFHADQAFAVLSELCYLTERHAYPREDAAAWIRVLRRFQGPGRRVVLAIAPTKPVVYPDRLPDSVPRAIRQACMGYRQDGPALTRLSGEAAALGLDVVYPLERFVARRLDDNFYPRESFHFSGLSAHLFAGQLLHVVGIEPGKNWRKEIDAEKRHADLAAIIGFDREIRATGFDYSAFGVQARVMRPEFISACYPRVPEFGTFETRNPITEHSALILSDSFGVFTARHLAPAYRTLTWINISELQHADVTAFFGTCLKKIDAEHLFFVFHDGGVLWSGKKLDRMLSGM